MSEEEKRKYVVEHLVAYGEYLKHGRAKSMTCLPLAIIFIGVITWIILNYR